MSTIIHDDYLECEHYSNKIGKKSSAYPGFLSFQHDDNNHYFAWVNDDQVIMRSEAYPDAEKMERGIVSVINNSNISERYSIVSENGKYILKLWGGGDHQKHTGSRNEHSEIARSCPKDTKEELNALLQFKGADFANKVVPIAGGATIAAAAAMTTPTIDTPSVSGGMGTWWKWLLPLLLLLAILFWWKSCNTNCCKMPAVAAVDTTTAMVPAVTHAETFAKETGVTLHGAAENGIENQLIAFIKDTSKAVDKTTWFNFDRLLFDTNKETLQDSSHQQLMNIAEILKAFPKVKLKLGGYTDNVGKPEANLKLSSGRANTVMSELVKKGTEATRLAAEGYGDQHPIGDNTTEEGRQQNRRIAVRVTEK
jgi:outer membrane protein OmpA-like peptidoglycan-associated protein